MAVLIKLSFGLTILLAAASCKKNDTDGAGGAGGTHSSGSDQCEPLCEKLAAASCDHTVGYDGCMITCLALTSASACTSVADDYFDCTDGKSVACSAWDDPYFQGCGDEYLIAVDCAVGEDPNPAMVEPCDDFCDAKVATGCANDNPKSECYSNCQWLGATGTGCDDEWMTYLDCANAATWSCVLEAAVPQGCGQDWLDYYACLDAIGN
ncbi:MAG: hypothetical protein DRI90_26420 [Deltaproteobacteria bacterium]|nr:MAG: hypothetical protein DRI90_26420 [Deltaproteobacteria bacterium]